MPFGFSGVSGVCIHSVMNQALTDPAARWRTFLVAAVKGRLETVGLIE